MMLPASFLFKKIALCHFISFIVGCFAGVEIRNFYRTGCFHASAASDTSVVRGAHGASSCSWGSGGAVSPPAGSGILGF